MRRALSTIFIVYLFLLVCNTANARKLAEQPERVVAPPQGATDNPANRPGSPGFMAPADADTTWLLSSNFNGGICDPQGWTSVDLTHQEADYWHVEHYTGLPFGPLQGFKSLWCGTRSGTDPILCQYLTLPGYGNSWNQSWCTKACLNVSKGATANLDVSFDMRFHTEPSYDAVSLEYTTDCTGNVGWTAIDGGNPVWTGVNQLTVNGSYPVGSLPVKVRLHFVSDTAWSDSDGFYPSNGAVHIDNLQVETLALEQFEDESAGDTASNDWQSCNTPGYGDHAFLLKGSDVLQEDPCIVNVSCLWAFIKDSTYNYACGGHAEQAVVPYRNSRDEYLNNEIWSPMVPASGSGSTINMQFDVYKDLPLDALIFYACYARTIVNGCPTPWKDRNFVFVPNDSKQWFKHVEEFGAVLNITNATHLQFAIGVVDMCPFWCGVFGTSACHSHAPLIDNVKAFRVNTSGPQWSVNGLDTFQDTFATDGTTTGTARADIARDVGGWNTNSVIAGDSSVVIRLSDPNYAVGTGTNSSGLSNDPNISTFIGRHKTKKQAYLYAAVWPLGQPGKSGAPLSEGPGGQANRYPFSGTVVAGGVTWTKIRMDYSYNRTFSNPGDGTGTTPYQPNRFNVDLNDNLFTPGDTICYFYGATSPGETSYYSSNWHMTNNIEEVAANPMEFTILPAGGWKRGGNTLYVDGADGLGFQPYFDGAFLALGLEDKIDRYDVRDPSSSSAENRLSTRVVNVQQQLNDCYTNIIWDCGSLSRTLGDGESPMKSDDYGLLNTFLGNLTNPGGVYLSGDDVAEWLADPHHNASPSTLAFKSLYMQYSLASGNHQAAGLGVSPIVSYWPGRCFEDDFTTFGGCPELNDFDVLTATGSSLVEMSYGTAQSASGAVLSHTNGNARVLMSGFSFAHIRDDEADGVSDRAKHLRDILVWLGTSMGGVTGSGPALGNRLAQNYPNPFNPQTTIAFSLKARGHVEVSIYDVGGRLVRTLANETRAPGAHQLTWDGRDGNSEPVASGVYFYRLTTPGFSQTRKMVLLK